MSLTKSTTRRVALFTSSSLVAAGIAAAASLGFALTPTAAFAANECGDPAANGTAADTFVCPVATYPTGIQHTAVGDLTLSVQVGSNFGTGGVVTNAGASATDPDDLTVRFTGSTTSSSASFNTQPFARLFDVQSQTGDILVGIDVFRSTSAGFLSITANNAATTHGVYAVSHQGGDVQVLRGGSTANSSLTVSGAASIAAIEARSIGGGNVTVGDGSAGFSATGGDHGIWAVTDGGGAISIDLGDTSSNAKGRGQGRLYGIRAAATGTGDLTIYGDGQSQNGGFGIHATTGSGLTTIEGRGQSAAAGGIGVYIDAGGDVEFNGGASGAQYGIYLENVRAGTTTTLDLSQDVSGGVADIFAQGDGDLDVNILGQVVGMNYDFTGMADPVVVNIVAGAAWRPANGVSTVPDGNFVIDINEGGLLLGGTQSSGNNTLEPPVVVNFAGTSSSLINNGFVVVSPDPGSVASIPRGHEGELRLVGLEEFRNFGDIIMGTRNTFGGTGSGETIIRGVWVSSTDGWHDDMFVFEDGTWFGEGGRIIMDVDTSGVQADCTREAVTNDFPAADCVRVVNSTVEGVTYVHIKEIIAGDRGRLNQQMMDTGILLIDAPGSTVTAENFQIDPGLRGFNPVTGTLDKGLFQYALLFNEDTSQYRLFPTLSSAAYQLPMAATAAHNMWRVSTGSWLNRQADLRGSMPEQLGGGIWMRALGEQTDREITSVTTLGGLPYSVDSNHRADTYAINGGVDIFSGSDGHTGYVVGLTAGYAHTDVEYETSGNTQAMDAWTGGVYGGLVVGQLFVDAVVSANNVIIDTDAPGFNFSPEGTILSSRMMSLGGQVEAGWRMLFDGGLFLEPIASVSYVRSKMDDLEILPDDQARRGLEVSFEDPSSFRAGVGARFGIDTNFAGMRTQASFLVRTWQDLEGQNTASIHNLAFPDDPDIRVVDEFSDQFHEVALGGSVWAPNGLVSGFLNLGGKWGEDYEAKTGTVGVRVAW